MIRVNSSSLFVDAQIAERDSLQIVENNRAQKTKEEVKDWLTNKQFLKKLDRAELKVAAKLLRDAGIAKKLRQAAGACSKRHRNGEPNSFISVQRAAHNACHAFEMTQAVSVGRYLSWNLLPSKARSRRFAPGNHNHQ
jgi:hypothetical protein